MWPNHRDRYAKAEVLSEFTSSCSDPVLTLSVSGGKVSRRVFVLVHIDTECAVPLRCR